MKWVSTLGLLLGISQAYCEDPSRLQFGGNYTHASIKIHGQPLFHGNLGGAEASYEYRAFNHVYAGVKAGWKQGQTNSRYLVYVDAQERVGYTFGNADKLFTLFSGLGYRHFSHRLHSLKFYYNEIYVAVGFLFDYFFKPWASLGFNFTWMPQVYPTVKIVPLRGARWILKNTLGNFMVEAPLTFTFTHRYSLAIKPFYEYWEDGRSTAKMSTGVPLGLPGNIYNFWGAEVNFGYSF